MTQADHLDIEFRAKVVAKKDLTFPASNKNFTVIRELRTFKIVYPDDEFPTQPCAVRLVANYTAEDVEAVPEGEQLLLGIWFDKPTLLWTSNPPVYADHRVLDRWWGREWFTFAISEPNPDGGQYILDISGDLSDPAVGIGSG
jgi:hypothetical protein